MAHSKSIYSDGNSRKKVILKARLLDGRIMEYDAYSEYPAEVAQKKPPYSEMYFIGEGYTYSYDHAITEMPKYGYFFSKIKPVKSQYDKLLLPRFRVEHRDTDSPFYIGDIFVFDPSDKVFKFKDLKYTEEEILLRSDLFRRLGWAEYREKEEMPKYVLYTKSTWQTVELVLEWRMSPTNAYCLTAKSGDYVYWHKSYLLPATEAQYKNQFNKP